MIETSLQPQPQQSTRLMMSCHHHRYHHYRHCQCLAAAAAASPLSWKQWRRRTRTIITDEESVYEREREREREMMTTCYYCEQQWRRQFIISSQSVSVTGVVAGSAARTLTTNTQRQTAAERHGLRRCRRVPCAKFTSAVIVYSPCERDTFTRLSAQHHQR